MKKEWSCQKFNKKNLSMFNNQVISCECVRKIEILYISIEYFPKFQLIADK